MGWRDDPGKGLMIQNGSYTCSVGHKKDTPWIKEAVQLTHVEPRWVTKVIRQLILAPASIGANDIKATESVDKTNFDER